jgi:hypothetical protein
MGFVVSMFQNSVLKGVSQDESIVALRWAKFADKLEERNFKNDWKALFENDKKEVLELQQQINTIDKEIDVMVYELYGLSDDEIEIVENT